MVLLSALPETCTCGCRRWSTIHTIHESEQCNIMCVQIETCGFCLNRPLKRLPSEQIHINAVLIVDVMDSPMSCYAAWPEGLLAAL